MAYRSGVAVGRGCDRALSEAGSDGAVGHGVQNCARAILQAETLASGVEQQVDAGACVVG